MTLLTGLINAITAPIRIIFFWIMQCTPGLKKLPGVSLPMRLALMTFIFLLIVVTTAVVTYSFSDSATKNYWQWIVAALLVFVIPVVVYYLVKISMQKEESKFPDIDRIWATGLDECARQGIYINNVPLFLVQGARDHRQASQLIRASQIPFSVTVPTQEDSDIVFFANSDAIFLFIQGCSCISRLSSAPTGPSVAPLSQPTQRSAPAAHTGTIDASMFSSPQGAGPGAPAAADIGQTLAEGAFPPPLPAAVPAAEDIGRTMLLPEGQAAGNYFSAGPAVHAPAVPQLSSQDITLRDQKLRYVCKLIRAERQTLCPINGLLTLLPFELIESAASQIQTAAQKDLAILREELQVRCSNTVLVTQLDKEEGFQELINRVGEQRTRDFRFGKGCELWNSPEMVRLDAIATHAVGAFEDWIYMLFQEENALKHRYNSRLFMLLCRVRGQFAENLRVVLARGFGFDPATEPQLAQEQFLFGGCYFAASGADPSRQAFVKSVLMKGIQQEGELEWAPAARKKDSQLQFLSNLFVLLGALSLLSILVMLILRFVVWK
ncbi:MAG: hypothetical protein KDB22_15060 [Planctomycetales bacterium]|nr:hypothetical protein [Planctomycetales bacterium]